MSFLTSNAPQRVMATGRGWRDHVVDATNTRVGASAPTFANFRNGLWLLSFGAASVDEVHASIHLNHDYAMGTAIYPHIHWSPGSSTNTGVVRWGIEYSFARGHNVQAFPASTTIYLEQAGSGTQYQHQLIEMADPGVVDANLETDGVLLLRVFRDGSHVNDTFTGAAFLISMDIHYQVDHFTTTLKTRGAGSPNPFES